MESNSDVSLLETNIFAAFSAFFFLPDLSLASLSSPDKSRRPLISHANFARAGSHITNTGEQP